MRSSLGPVPNSRVHAIGSSNNAVQHLINRADDDARNPTAGLINPFLDPSDEGIIVFEGALTDIDGITMPKTAILPEAVPMLFFLARGVEALQKKEGRVARADEVIE